MLQVIRTGLKDIGEHNAVASFLFVGGPTGNLACCTAGVTDGTRATVGRLRALCTIDIDSLLRE